MTDKPKTEISPETKKVLKAYCDKKREQLGPDWIEIESKRMADETTKQLMPLLDKLNSLRPRK